MQTGNSIINLPLFIGAVISLAIHSVILSGNKIHTEPVILLDAGQTVIQLTLTPSVASQLLTEKKKTKESGPEVKEKPSKEPVKELSEPPDFPTPITIPKPKTKEPLSPEPAQKYLEQTLSKPFDASLQPQKGVTAEPRTARTIIPTYPRLSRQRGEEGRVIILVEVRSNGNIGQISVVQSSGHRRLDNAALKAVQKAPFIPATLCGQAIDSSTELSFTFRLTDE